MKIHFVRHQAAGVLHQFPFAEPPSDVQLSAIARWLDATWGLRHPKTKEPYWVRVVHVEVLGADAVMPEPSPPRDPSARSGGALEGVDGRGAGHVNNPGRESVTLTAADVAVLKV